MSRDGRQLAYEFDFDIWVSRSDGRLRRRLVVDGEQPDWSPDGRRIVFIRSDAMYVINADGTQERRLTKGDDFDSEPSWSPDGERIVFSRGFELWLTKADGRTPRRLNRCGSEPDWSPDRRRIAFVCESEIYTIRPDGSGTTRLTKNDVDEIDPAGARETGLHSPPRQMTRFIQLAAGGGRRLHRERRERHVTVLVARRAPHRVRQRPP